MWGRAMLRQARRACEGQHASRTHVEPPGLVADWDTNTSLPLICSVASAHADDGAWGSGVYSCAGTQGASGHPLASSPHRGDAAIVGLLGNVRDFCAPQGGGWGNGWPLDQRPFEHGLALPPNTPRLAAPALAGPHARRAVHVYPACALPTGQVSRGAAQGHGWSCRGCLASQGQADRKHHQGQHGMADAGTGLCLRACKPGAGHAKPVAEM